MITVVDASAAVEIYLNKEMAKLFQDWIDASEIVLAPDIFPSEITNIFWKYRTFSGFSESECKAGIDCCLDMIDDFMSTRTLCQEVFAESARLRHPSYDLFYLLVARRNGGAILSRDKKLLEAAKVLGVVVPDFD